jgi:hypothetical protein
MSKFFACPLHLDQRRPVEKAGKRNCVRFVPAFPLGHKTECTRRLN